jgi:hypothetical protein
MLLEADPWEFLRWDVIASTMVKRGKVDITNQLSHLQKHPDWRTRWRPALREHTVGFPRPFYRHPKSSGSLIQHAYEACRFEEATGVPLASMRVIVEFGGGFGCMCRTLHQLGFTGSYLIYDLPELSTLQRFFLPHVGVRTGTKGATQLPPSGVVTISAVDGFKRLVRSRPPGPAAFIATWSLSEAPLALRAAILSELTAFEAFLLSYGEFFEGVDNRTFFADWRRGFPDHLWHEVVVPVARSLKPSWYLFSAKRSRGPGG